MSKGPGANPPLHHLTPDDRGPIIIIVAYSWVCISSITALIRFVLAWSHKLRFKADDATFLLGTAYAVASSVCFHLAVIGGLGKRITAIDQSSLDRFYKMNYVAELMGICAMASAKISVVLLSDRVAPQTPRSYYFMLGLVGLWIVFSLFATAFQCALPHPWVFIPSECPSKGNLQYPVIVLNIITDAFLAFWIFPTLRNLRIESGRRVTVMILFGSRLLVCGFAIAQLSSVARHIRSTDVTYAMFGRVLWELCVIHLSVLLATIPRMNHFIAALQSFHATSLITEFELSHVVGTQSNTPKDLSLDTSKAITTMPSEVHTRSNSRSHSLPRSSKSREPLIEMSLESTQSLEQRDRRRAKSDVDREERRKRISRSGDWKKYLPRQSKSGEEDMNLSTLFSFSSGIDEEHSRVIKAREATQVTEAVRPREARWNSQSPIE